ncbi:MAG: flagellar M-ring protein FliF, partial [Fibromonadales bacterium]|nr:flagellar M-ring protein FliF [Fibromonadales bacterium]
NNGRTILIPKNNIHEARMALARNGLPRAQNKGYELFDANQLGMTDFAQNLNYRRAVEAELARSIETFNEVERARVHVNIPKQTLFMEKKEDPSASVIIMLRPGGDLQKSQVKGIQHLVASAIESLKNWQVTVLDAEGNMLTEGYNDQGTENTNHNMELRRSVEAYLKRQVLSILDGVLGPNKSRVAVFADLDFDQISRTEELYDPKIRAVRSEQRDDGTRSNVPPEAGSETREGSITNYEVNRVFARIISSPGATKRLTVSALVDGTYEQDTIYRPRSEEEIAILNGMIKNAVGYSPGRNDSVYVASWPFDRSQLKEEHRAMTQEKNQSQWEKWALYATIVLIVILAFIFLRKVAISLIEAMNPPVPRHKEISIEAETEEVPEPVRKQNELIGKISDWVIANPEPTANTIKGWMLEGMESQSASRKKK